MNTYTQAFIEEMHQKLLEHKQRLEAELAGTPKHTELGNDEDGSAQEVELDDVNQDIRFQVAKDLEKIDKALQKIQEGSYGVDDDGNQISEERLRAIPWADKAI